MEGAIATATLSRGRFHAHSSRPLPPVKVRRAAAEDRPVLERLGLHFRHEPADSWITFEVDT